MTKSKASHFGETLLAFAEEALNRYGDGVLEGVRISAQLATQVIAIAGMAFVFAMAYVQADRMTRSCMKPDTQQAESAPVSAAKTGGAVQ